MKKTLYFTDIKDYAKWFKKEKRIYISIQALLEEPYLSKLLISMQNENARRKEDFTKGGETSAELYGGKFLTEWAKENVEEFKESSTKGGVTQGTINKEQGTGIFSQTKEEWSENGSKNAKVFWETATEEEINTRNKKAGDSIKKTIKENGYWNPHQYITPETRKQMTKNQMATRLSQKQQRIKELFDKISTDDWFSLEYAAEVLASYTNKEVSLSTVRRLIHGWKEAHVYYEFRKTETNELGNKFIQYKKLKN